MSVTTSMTREPSVFWLNVGYVSQGKQITLPFGIPLDSMKDVDTRSKNEDWAKTQIARNALLAQLRKIAAGCEPGSQKEVGLKVSVRRASKQEDTEPVGVNSYIEDIPVIG